MRTTMTARGFILVEFQDSYQSDCSIQESSLVAHEEQGAYIWFGTHRDRMHLSQEQLKELLPILTHFAESGSLPVEPNETLMLNKNAPADEPHPEPDPRELEKAARAVKDFIQSYSPASGFAIKCPDLYDLIQKYAKKVERALGDVPERNHDHRTRQPPEIPR